MKNIEGNLYSTSKTKSFKATKATLSTEYLKKISNFEGWTLTLVAYKKRVYYRSVYTIDELKNISMLSSKIM